ncbi:MAG: hypothetical protein DDT42_01859 [candidate division WS2 bacterium]|uniref:PKD domain-containing protein n=1 Tax=Psychracetigena formicireducens TaxID=2986056 RepID=A0A9E2F733_PSYF1|nr:hypothetical protein [Candidatus Psychracetigena formicireducens]
MFSISTTGCIDSIIKIVVVKPILPIAAFNPIGGDTLRGCKPFRIQVQNNSRFASNFEWSFGNGVTYDVRNPPAVTYFDAGTYSITLIAKNSLGNDTLIRRDVVVVDEEPAASFSFSPPVITLPNDVVRFQNLSIGATQYLWIFGDGSTSTEVNPEYIYKDTGSFSVTLIAISEAGCRDTLQIRNAVKAENNGRIQVPNAFTPFSSTNVNDVFLPVMDGAASFRMQIFNRWGEIIFESNDAKTGWDGRHRGKNCTPDLYTYVIGVSFSDGSSKTLKGGVYLIK